jgi:hypothetical protein
MSCLIFSIIPPFLCLRHIQKRDFKRGGKKYSILRFFESAFKSQALLYVQVDSWKSVVVSFKTVFYVSNFKVVHISFLVIHYNGEIEVSLVDSRAQPERFKLRRELLF